MKKSLLTSVCVAAVALGAATVQAQADPLASYSPNFYVSIFGGIALPEDSKGSATNATGTSFSITSESDDGFTAGLAVGTHVNEWLRGEVEFSYADIGADKFKGSNATTSFSYSAKGGSDAYYILANLWADLPVDMVVKPYVGGGLGLGIVDADVKVGPGGAFGPNNSDTGFAFQLGAGLKYDLSEMATLDLGYRYKSITGLDFNDRAGGLAKNKNFELDTHTLQIGVSFEIPPM